MIAGNGTIRDGWLECDGRAVSRTMFPDLFNAIGTTYGAGDGSTTFNLPNYSDGKFPEGATVAGVVKQAGLPNITGSFKDFYGGSGMSASGAFSVTTSTTNKSVTGGAFYVANPMSFSAQNSNSLYGASNTVQPYSCTTRYIIKAYDGVTPTPAEADISEMLTELTGKADRDLDNLTQTAKDLITNSCAPDYSSILSNVGNNYTAPTNGIFYFSLDSNNSTRNISVNGTELTWIYNSYGSRGGIPIVLAKGDIVNVANNAALDYSYFVPLKGAL
jgi:microcystin-dependent protein